MDSNGGSAVVASSYSTGGGGFSFERRVAVRYLAAMLSGAPRQLLGDRRVVRVSFQQSSVSPVDDVHVLGARDEENDPSMELWVAARRRPKFVLSDPPSQELVASLVEAAALPEEPGRDRCLVVCVAGHENRAALQVAQLANLARDTLSEESFQTARARLARPIRERFGHLQDLTRVSVAEGSEFSVWQFLRQLHVILARVEPPDEEDWAALLGELESWSRDQTPTGAEALRGHLEHLADQYDPAAAEVDRPRLCQDAHSLLHDNRRLLAGAWEELRRLQAEAREHVRSHCGNEPFVTLRRDAARDEMVKALTSARVLSVSGQSGVGKSALVCSALDDLHCTSSDSVESLYLSLRLLPPSSAELRAVIGAPLEEALAEMTAPTRLVVIDAADRAAETYDTPLTEIVRCAVAAGVAVCVVSASEASDTVEGLVAESAGRSPRRHSVPVLADDEIRELAQALPVLGAMAGDHRGRELLQLPVYADLLARSDVSGTPFSQSAAMDVIWQGRIRGERRRDRGSPDAREQAMRQLALHELNPSDPDQLFASLDAVALEGLQRDDILRSSRRSSPLPVFAHDILRDFAVAKVLTSTDDPVQRLQEFDTPRAAIPAARLALESQMQNSADRVALLDQLQGACDALVASGASDRWGDLPVEVVLRIPEAGELLAGSWDSLANAGGTGLKRVLRLLAQRHTHTGIAEVRAAAPVASLLVERGWPKELQDPVESFLAAWLCGLVIRAAPRGNEARVGLRSLLEYKVAVGERRQQQRAEEMESRRTARTPEQVAADRERATRVGVVAGPWSGRRRRERQLPPELRGESTMRLLALLGHDLGPSGEALLRRVAEHDPSSLQAAVEAPLAGSSLAQYDSALLIDLVEAYYIDNDADALNGALSRHGVREHEFHGLASPMAAPWYGPFLAMFRYDFARGVACLNRLLDHAVRFQAQQLSRSHWGGPNHGAAEDQGVELSLLGSPGLYVGRHDAWLWYRVVYSGPLPCTSALQALEIVCDQLLEDGAMPPDELIDVLLSGCGNLAMPALAYGVMVRHLERFQRSLDAFLVEPFVWRAETQRVVQERSGPVSQVPTVIAPERRKWIPMQTVMWLVLHAADEDRAQELRALGETYFENATAGPEDVSGDPERRAVARRHALAFDRDEYEVTRDGDRLIFQQRVDPDVESALADSRREHQRSMEALRLEDRYAERSDQIRAPAPLDAEELRSDIATARDLMADPPAGALDSEAAAASVAAATLEGYFLDGIVTGSDDVAWAAMALAGIVRERRDRSIAYDTNMPTFFWRGADRGAGRGLPLLLREDARSTRSQLAAEGFEEDDLLQVVLWLFTCAPIETRYAASRALDSVWQSPCTGSDSCPHQVALDLVEESLRYTRTHRWRPGEEPEYTPLAGPVVEALAGVEPELVVLSALNPALRALGAEAGAATCVHQRASELLDATLEAHRRARQAIDHGHHTQWDALFAARAVLQRAAAGNTSAVREHIAAFRGHFDGLWECLLALAAAAEESPRTAAAATAVWPTVIRDGLRFFEEADHEDSNRDNLRVQDQIFAALLPSLAPDNMYAYREMQGDPVAWIVPAVWRPEIDQWVDAAVANHDSASTSSRPPNAPARALPASGVFGTIDALVSMLHAPAVEERARIGIHWVERLVLAGGEAAARTFSLPEWLRAVRPHCGPSEQEAWERIVDHLFVHGDPRVRSLAD